MCAGNDNHETDLMWRLTCRQAALDETLLKIAEAAGPAGGTGESFLAVPTDVTDAASVENLFLQCQSVFGRVDVLFNNAGVGAPAVPLEDLDLETWRKVVDVNLTGVFLCTQQAFRVMKAQEPQGGRIINNGSVSAVAPRPLSSAYTATKHAVTGLTKSTSLDGRKVFTMQELFDYPWIWFLVQFLTTVCNGAWYVQYDIACGQIDIGNAATDMTAGVRSGPGVLQPTIDGSERFAQVSAFIRCSLLLCLSCPRP